MKNLTVLEENRPSDCDVLIGKAEHTLNNLENCIDTVFDNKKTKLNVIGSIFRFTFSLTKLTFSATTCAIKNTPKVVVAVAAVKREIVADLENNWNQYQKEQQEEALNEKIKQLTFKG
jgi:hypothetical protein